MRHLALIAVLLIAGCTHASVQMNSGGGAAVTTTSVSTGYSGRGSAAMWALIGIGLIAAQYGDSQAARERGLEDPGVPVRPLDDARRVHEQDCTQPIKDWSANLKCR